jgi:hypothetical protein
MEDLAVDEQLMFVQFPHRRAEHQPDGATMEWSRLFQRGRRVEHARKFLRARGSYISGPGGPPVSGPLAFWGEWEPQSRVVAEYPQVADGKPRWLHEPYWRRPGDLRPRHNTDPLVFGERFTYSNCRQEHNAKLRHLASGSVILFGSGSKTEFVLDTVLVVDEGARHYDIARSGEMPEGPDLLQGVVFELLRSILGGPRRKTSFRLYSGRSYADAPEGPFSFVPCRPADDPEQCAFARPVIRLPGTWLAPSSWRAARCVPATPAELNCLWDEVVRQVAGDGLALGVRLDTPEEVTAQGAGRTEADSTADVTGPLAEPAGPEAGTQPHDPGERE